MFHSQVGLSPPNDTFPLSMILKSNIKARKTASHHGAALSHLACLLSNKVQTGQIQIRYLYGWSDAQVGIFG